MRMLSCVILFLFAYCSNNRNDNNSISKIQKGFSFETKDTSINYYLEGISTEGTEIKASYSNKKIVECEINIFGETGQAKIIYKFTSKNIIVSQKQYRYKKQLDEVKSQNDMKLSNNIEYIIDYKGNIIGKKPNEMIDIFSELKKKIPFKLK